VTTRPHAGATNETTPAVRAEGLVKTFGEQRAVDHVDLEVRRGQVFGVLGPNGDGRAAIFGHDVRREPHVARQLLGSPGSTRRTTRNLTATENLMIFARLQGVAKPISAHSGGMRRCLDLAASLITRPPLILLDEPTTGLDPRARGRMWDTIRDLVANGCTVLLTTQYLDEARDTCTWSAFGARRVVGPDPARSRWSDSPDGCSARAASRSADRGPAIATSSMETSARSRSAVVIVRLPRNDERLRALVRSRRQHRKAR
jgi:ABC-type Na+ transport system ATPase subunit NatA